MGRRDLSSVLPPAPSPALSSAAEPPSSRSPVGVHAPRPLPRPPFPEPRPSLWAWTGLACGSSPPASSLLWASHQSQLRAQQPVPPAPTGTLSMPEASSSQDPGSLPTRFTHSGQEHFPTTLSNLQLLCVFRLKSKPCRHSKSSGLWPHTHST